MLSRTKKNKPDSDIYRAGKPSNDVLSESEKKQKQYRLLGGIGIVTFLIFLILYSNGSLSSTSLSARKKQYMVGERTQRMEETTNKILSAWGQQDEALKFANLPSSGNGYLTVPAMVVQQDQTEKKEDIQLFYREASKLNPGGFGIASHVHAFNKPFNKLMGGVSKGLGIPRVDELVESKMAQKEDMDDFVIDKDVTLIFLHGANYASSTWEELGTLGYFANLGYKIYAIDIPGHGHSQKVTVNSNGWLIDAIIKLVTSQEEEGNIDEDGGEHRTDSHQKKGKNDVASDAAPSSKKIHNIAIIAPDFSARYTLNLLRDHQTVLGREQGISLVKYIPLAISTHTAYGYLKDIYGDILSEHVSDHIEDHGFGNPVQRLHSDGPLGSALNKLFEDNIVDVCSIGGGLDFNFIHNNLIFKYMPHSNTVFIRGASMHIYLDNPDVFHKIIYDFLTTGACEIDTMEGNEIDTKGNNPEDETEADIN